MIQVYLNCVYSNALSCVRAANHAHPPLFPTPGLRAMRPGKSTVFDTLSLNSLDWQRRWNGVYFWAKLEYRSTALVIGVSYEC